MQIDTLTGAIKHSTFKTLQQSSTTTTFQMQNTNNSDNNKGISAPASLHCDRMNGVYTVIIQFCPLLNGGKGHSEVSEVDSTPRAVFVWRVRGRSENRSVVW